MYKRQPEDAPIISLDPQNNQELFISDNGTTIVNSKTGSVEAFRTKAEFRSASAFKPVDISDKTSFFVKPQTRATSYNYMLNINIVETQGSTNWCFAYVTATALRYKGKNVRASTITNYFNLGTQTALSVDNAKKYCKTKGVTYDGRYSGSIMNSFLHGYLRGGNPVHWSMDVSGGGKMCIRDSDYIDMSFGTAVMKCTPAHDPNDFALAKKYHLAMPICMHPDGTMNEMAHKYEGMDRFACRKALVADFEQDGVVDHIEQHMHQVGHSERTGVIVEPYLSKQWFVRMEPLAAEVLKNQTIADQKINFYPQRFEKTFHQWLENIEDWCISRQLWWGHRIPAWYHKETEMCIRDRIQGASGSR